MNINFSQIIYITKLMERMIKLETFEFDLSQFYFLLSETCRLYFIEMIINKKYILCSMLNINWIIVG